ncbi:MAG: GNAT family N-acetyltransferase [Candidatus Cloacimonas sp.]|nr:GNAT family N-acetyltransferase [Candidatus Cloacimonas sp.]MDY0218444.1 GNAT family protein [Candidatus Cloacimonas acidaminovorans]
MKNIRLRALTITDLPLTLKWHNQPDIIEMYAGHPFPVNEEMERKWYEKILTSNFPVTVFGIELIENNKLIGLTTLRDINLIIRSAETAIYIGDQNERSKGYSKEALKLTLNFAFNNLGLHRVFLSVREDNVAAIGLYEKMGFIREGILRDSIYKDGKYISLIIMSILEGEFYG